MNIHFLAKEYIAESGEEEPLDEVEDRVEVVPSGIAALASAKVDSVLGEELYRSGPHSRLFKYLINTISKLETEKQALAMQLEEEKLDSKTFAVAPPLVKAPTEDVLKSGNEDMVEGSPIFETFHVVWYDNGDNFEELYFRDVPRKFKGDSRTDRLRGRDEVENATKYLDSHPRTAFVIIHEYSPERYRTSDYHTSSGSKTGRLTQDAPPAESDRELVMTGPNVSDGLRSIIESHPDKFLGFPAKDFPKAFEHPYLPFYHKMNEFITLLNSTQLDEYTRSCVKFFLQWVEDKERSNWNEADELFSRRKVNIEHYNKLFRPDEILISREPDGQLQAMKIEPYPWRYADDLPESFYWVFNGSFGKRNHKMSSLLLDYIFTEKGSQKDKKAYTEKKETYIERDITSLEIFPLRFAEEGVYQKLLARGEKFWNCRKKKLVCYRESGQQNISEVSGFVTTTTIDALKTYSCL